MPLNKLDNFIKNTEGRILYVNPNDLDSTDSITNQGNSLAQPFKTVQRALLEAARFSYVKGSNNDIVEKTTILLFPGEHVIDNRPGFGIKDVGGTATAVDRSGSTSLASAVFSLGLDSNFDITSSDNILYKFNSYYGGVIVPRGTSIVGLDLRKTKIRPKYVPNPTDTLAKNSSIFKITGACYFWQFSFFDGDLSSTVYTNPDNFGAVYQSTPNFSHHKLTCFEYADGVNSIGDFGLTDLDMYYSKVANAYNAYRDIDQKFPSNSEGFAKSRSEWEIVGAFSSDPIDIETITSSGSVVTVTTANPHELNVGTPIKIKGVSGSGVVFPYNISTTVQNILSSTSFTYLLPSLSSYPTINTSPSATDATVTIETDTVSGASPYIFNCSMRSVWGMNGLHADGSKASGFRSVVVAQFTGVSLQKDDRAFAKYNKSTQTYESISPITAVYGSNLSNGSSSTTSSQIYHLDPDAVYRKGWETSHIKITNDAFVQVVSVFAIGFNKHFDAESGGDGSITNSNSNFGQLSLSSSGFKKEAFDKDNNAFITSIVPPRAIVTSEENIEWLSIDVGVTTTVGISSHLYLYGFNAQDSAPFSLTQGYRVGARTNDKLYANLGAGTSEASIYMCDNEISSTGLTTALGTTSSVKSYIVTSGPTSNSFTIGSNNLLTGEKVKILSDTGNLPENIEPHQTYYVINNGDNDTIKLSTSKASAEKGQAVTVYGGSNLHILSRVSDKESGELGSPIQFDAENNNWFIHVNANNQIYSALSTGGVATYGTSTDFAYIKRITDERSLDEKLYKLRVVIPKELPNAKNPEIGFVIQETSTTGQRTDTDFTKTSIGSSEYQYKKNPRFIASCSVVSSTVTVISELPHNLQVNDVVIVRNVKCTNNTSGAENLGYNGRFTVSGVSDAYTFTYSTTDLNSVLHNPGTFTSDVNTRNVNLPRFERNDLQSNLYVYRSEVISPYINDWQDGVYHVYALNANNAIDNEFTNLKFGQLPTDLYPQLDRDNVDANPPTAKTYAKRSPIGVVVTNDLKKSITRETADLTLKSLGIGKEIASVTPTSAGLSTITFSRFHGLSGIVTYSSLTGGSGHTNGTYYNVRLYNEVGLSNWDGATAKVVVSGAGNSVTSAEIISGGSGYTNGETLYFDNAQIGGTVDASITIATSGISTNIGDVVQVTGIGTTTDGYYRIASVPSSTSVALAKTAGDPEILSNQYAFIVGSSVKVNSSDYVSATGITTFTTATAHGLFAGHQFRVIDSNSNNLGDYIVKEKVNLTTFTAVTNASLSVTDGYILKHGLSANEAISDKTQENFGVRQVSFYDSETFTLSSEITTGTSITLSNVGVGTDLRLPLGSYIQIDSEILRVLSITGANTFTVSRGALGTDQETHVANSLVRKIKPVAIELRRPSILRASGHTFEYLGYGPGNYSTSLPQVQVKTLSEQEEFLSQSQERSGGVLVYTGMNNSGDFYNGNTKTSAVSGEVISYDIPIPTVTGQETGALVSAFDELAIKGRLLVEGGASGSVLSQFNGPVTFNKDVRVKAPSIFSDDVKITDTTQSTSTTTGALTVSGGVGISKNLYVGGNSNVTGTLNVGDFLSSGTSRFNSFAQSTSKDTGALVIEGGVGIERNLNVGGTLNVANTTQSTSKDTGALVVEGGIGIEKNLNVGGTLNVAGVSTFIGITSISNTTQSTSKDTGALVVEGGVGIEKNVNIGGTVSVLNVNVSNYTTYEQVGILSGTYTSEAAEHFGYSVASSYDGSTMIIGSPGENYPPDPTEVGLAYVFDRSGDTFTQVGILSAASGGGVTIQNNNDFGHSVAMTSDGLSMVVGAPLAEFSGLTQQGLAFVYDRSGSTFTRVGILSSSDPDGSDYFGYSVAMKPDGSTIVVGELNGEKDSGSGDYGAVHIFDRSGSTFTHVGIITSGESGKESDDGFGQSVAITEDGSLIVVGAPGDQYSTGTNDIGLAYVFERPGGTGSTFNRIGILSSTDPSSGDNFGYSVAVTQNSNNASIVVGVRSDEVSGGNESGLAYVFDRSGTSSTFNLVETIVPLTLGTDDRFGYSVAINSDGSRIIVGAPNANKYDNGVIENSRGFAYVYERNAPVGSATTSFKLIRTLDFDGYIYPYSSLYSNIDFGNSVGISSDGTKALIGAPAFTNTVSNKGGRAFVFDLNAEEPNIYTTLDTGFVGIGTSVPTSKLEVKGEIAATNYRIVGTSSTTRDASIYVDAARNQYHCHIASFTAARDLRVVNLTNGRSVTVYLRNTDSSSRTITVYASETNNDLTTVNLASSTTAGAASVTSFALAATSGTAVVWVANIDGNIVGSVV